MKPVGPRWLDEFSLYVFFVRGLDIVELNVVVNAFFTERNGLVDLDSFWELTVRLQVSRLVSRVLENDVSSGIVIVSKADQDNVRLINPDFLAQLSTNVTETLDTIEAHSLKATIAQHFDHLGILLTIFFKDQLTF